MPDSPLTGKEVALTGRLFSLTRPEAADRIRGAGGIYVPEPGPGTGLLVAGNALGHLTAEGGVSRSLTLFQSLRKGGAPIKLVEEPEFLGMLGSEPEPEDFSRLYTAEQVSRIVEVPLAVVRAWVRRGLLQPARMAHRLAWFEFPDIVTARNLSRLTSAGVPASQIHRSLLQVASWLPDGQRVLGRLEAWAAGLRLRLPDGTWVEPSGQRLIDFHDGRDTARGGGGARGGGSARDGGARVVEFPVQPGPWPGGGEGTWFSRAVDAEEAGDLETATLLYEQALGSSPEPEIFFNLGNVLYDLGREANAAERYLQAIEADHAFAEAWNNLGNSLVAIGRLEEGIRAYETALTLEPEYPEPHCNLATVLDRVGQPARALAHRAVCQKAFPSPATLTLLRQPRLDGAED